MPARRFNKSTAVKYRLLDICAAVCGCALAAALVFYAGERFTVRGGLIYIDNKLLDESDYAVPFDSEIDLSELIPTDCFLVLPDDRSELAPQQVQAFIIPRSRIIGEIRLRLFPLNEIAVFS